jgi:cytochrome c biogenesis protein CcdA
MAAGAAGARAQSAPARAEVTPIVEQSPAAPSSELRAALHVRLPQGYHTNSNKPRETNLIPLTVKFGPLPAGIGVKEVVFPDAIDLVQKGASQPLSVFDGEFAIGAVLRVAPDAAPGDVRVPVEMRYQACNDTMCFIPVRIPTSWTIAIGASAGSKQRPEIFQPIKFGGGDAPTIVTGEAALPAPTTTTAAAPADDIAALRRFAEAGTTTGFQGTDDFLTFIRNAEQGIREKGLFEGRGPIAIALLVLLGGLALNLTPCVLPMIPINLAIIGAGTQAGSRGRGFLLGLAYGAAMAFVYGVLGLMVVLTASTFGTINSYWWFNAGIALLFVILALAMFDVIVIDFSRFSNGFRVAASGAGSFVVAFGMGAIAALLAGACVAPVVIQVVLLSGDLYAAGSGSALALPFLLGVGMAIPWPVAGAGIAALPKPGAWMVRIKQAFGVLILATAAYYAYEAYGILSNRWVDAKAVAASVDEKLKEGWHASLADGLAAAERENKPVLIDMWATWCKNCLVMDSTTLRDPAVTAALDSYVKVKFQAEDPDEPRVARVMQELGAKGLPTYVILKRKT